MVTLFVIFFPLVQAQEVLRSDERLRTNKQTVRELFESVWNEENMAAIEDLWAPKVTFHFRGQAETVTREGLREQVRSWHAAFPDLEFVVEDLIAEDDRVAARVTLTGTHIGAEWFGHSATGKVINVTEMMFFRLQKGIVVETWEDYDEYELRRKLGEQP